MNSGLERKVKFVLPNLKEKKRVQRIRAITKSGQRYMIWSNDKAGVDYIEEETEHFVFQQKSFVGGGSLWTRTATMIPASFTVVTGHRYRLW